MLVSGSSIDTADERLSATMLVSDVGTLTYAALNDVHLYVDGLFRSSHYDAHTAGIREAVSGCVIAVRVVDDHQTVDLKGFVASASNDLVSDSSWKCSSVEEAGWTMCEFDDSHWSAASLVARCGTPYHCVNLNVDRNANWIWAPSGDVAYCRKRLCSGWT